MCSSHTSSLLCGILLLLTIIHETEAWHGFSNVNFHCWPSTASSSSPTPWAACTGVNMRWVQPPPANIRAQEPFNVTYELTVDNTTFWPWAISTSGKNNIFASASQTTATGAMNWCLNTVCPSAAAATSINCCIHHVNVHSCPGTVANGLCGPWIPATGNIVTHSTVLVGPLQTGNWTSSISGLYGTGTNYVIAHFKFGDMHLALNERIEVIPRAVCGNDICEADENESCQSCVSDCGRCPLTDWQMALIVVANLLIIGGAIFVVVYFYYRARKRLMDESWIINWNDVKEEGSAHAFGSALSMASNSTSDSNNIGGNAARRQVFTKIGLYKSKTVAIKPIKKKSFLLTTAIRKEVSVVRALDHPNLVKFIGGSIEVPNVCIYTEYCPKGSLNDVLLNEDIPLSWPFRFSFATDIARGMIYLHQHAVYHGSLKSQNCIVDDRWAVKIADYGLPTYREHEVSEDTDPGDELYNSIELRKKAFRAYQAPELLQVKWDLPTAAADAYAFGVILIEIATRNDPYGDDGMDMLPADWTPHLPEDFTHTDGTNPDSKCPCPFDYQTLVEDCMWEDPSHRPNFDRIKKIIQTINPSKQSAVDLMMAMMEKYSKHLESIVAGRTQELIAEKQKTDRLLFAMLPRQVAEELKQGRTIAAEWFDTCTIYFSDIVGFTNLSGGSTPQQVVALLNKLYTCFDSVIDQYDVYKVETIGDAYMVVSGVPNKNGFNHVREIAKMSIDLVKESETFVIPHRSGEALRIRVGLHSGPVCAGVVGHKMPRYCLFGDTVNTASRMESNGEAYKIHCSDTTYELLTTKHTGFRFDRRGTIPIKGKGEMVTWWLTGKETAMDVAPIPALEVTALKNRKISAVSTGNDSGYNDKDSPDVVNGGFEKMEEEVPPEYCTLADLPERFNQLPPRLPPLSNPSTLPSKTLRQ